jgi:hypothetical protein
MVPRLAMLRSPPPSAGALRHPCNDLPDAAPAPGLTALEHGRVHLQQKGSPPERLGDRTTRESEG